MMARGGRLGSKRPGCRPVGEMVQVVDEARCGRCGRVLRPGYRFHGGTLRDLRCALRYPPLLRRSLVTALIVGSVLTAINQGDHLLAGQFTGAMAWKIPLTYCVPFVVSTNGALGGSRRNVGDDSP
jgi:hypothetical protein